MASETVAWLDALRRENSEALGFISLAGLMEYERDGALIVERDIHGKRVGFLLHGVPRAGGRLTIAMACVEVDRRAIGFGESMVDQLIERAHSWNCREVSVRVAADLPANSFWLAEGFTLTGTDYRPNRRNRAINIYTRHLWPNLFGL